MQLFLYNSGSQNMAPGMSITWKLLELPILGFHPRLAESETLVWAPEIDVLTSPPGDSEASFSMTTITIVPITLKPQELKEEQLSEQ